VAKEDAIVLPGTVVEALGGMRYTVKLDGTENTIQAHPCGKIRMNMIRITPGDKVTVEMSPYDLSKGRIMYRDK
jgi:translation initiation factor IF-1